MGAIELGEQRYVDLSTAEQFVLTISERGFGKRTSSFEYRTTGRGGKGIVAMDNRERDGSLRPKIGRLVASFPVEESDQLMLVTDAGQLIRSRVAEISIKGRKTRGVIVFNTAQDERVVAVERLSEEGEEERGVGGLRGEARTGVGWAKSPASAERDALEPVAILPTLTTQRARPRGQNRW